MSLNFIHILFIGILALFGVGLYGLLITRNLIKIVAMLQLLVKSALLAIVMAGKVSGRINLAQSMATTVIVADTLVAVIGLALAIQVQKQFGTLELTELATLRG
jgi:NADH:ubiquinone oxidoreductase subunit K